MEPKLPVEIFSHRIPPVFLSIQHNESENEEASFAMDVDGYPGYLDRNWSGLIDFRRNGQIDRKIVMRTSGFDSPNAIFGTTTIVNWGNMRNALFSPHCVYPDGFVFRRLELDSFCNKIVECFCEFAIDNDVQFKLVVVWKIGIGSQEKDIPLIYQGLNARQCWDQAMHETLGMNDVSNKETLTSVASPKRVETRLPSVECLDEFFGSFILHLLEGGIEQDKLNSNSNSECYQFLESRSSVDQFPWMSDWKSMMSKSYIFSVIESNSAVQTAEKPISLPKAVNNSNNLKSLEANLRKAKQTIDSEITKSRQVAQAKIDEICRLEGPIDWFERYADQNVDVFDHGDCRSRLVELEQLPDAEVSQLMAVWNFIETYASSYSPSSGYQFHRSSDSIVNISVVPSLETLIDCFSSGSNANPSNKADLAQLLCQSLCQPLSVLFSDILDWQTLHSQSEGEECRIPCWNILCWKDVCFHAIWEYCCSMIGISRKDMLWNFVGGYNCLAANDKSKSLPHFDCSNDYLHSKIAQKLIRMRICHKWIDADDQDVELWSWLRQPLRSTMMVGSERNILSVLLPSSREKSCVSKLRVLTCPFGWEHLDRSVTSSSSSSSELFYRMSLVMQLLILHPSSQPLCYPASNPRYDEVIRRPISLIDIAQWLRLGNYQTKDFPITEFYLDVCLVFENCFCCFSEGVAIVQAAHRLVYYFEQIFFTFIINTMSDDVCSYVEEMKHKLSLPCDVCNDDDESAQLTFEEAFRCRGCWTNGDRTKMIYCDRCDSGWHIGCLPVPLASHPRNEWVCGDCISEKRLRNADPRIGAKIGDRKEIMDCVPIVSAVETGCRFAGIVYAVRGQDQEMTYLDRPTVDDMINNSSKNSSKIRFPLGYGANDWELAACLCIGHEDWGESVRGLLSLSPHVADGMYPVSVCLAKTCRQLCIPVEIDPIVSKAAQAQECTSETFASCVKTIRWLRDPFMPQCNFSVLHCVLNLVVRSLSFVVDSYSCLRQSFQALQEHRTSAKRFFGPNLKARGRNAQDLVPFALQWKEMRNSCLNLSLNEFYERLCDESTRKQSWKAPASAVAILSPSWSADLAITSIEATVRGNRDAAYVKEVLAIFKIMYHVYYICDLLCRCPVSFELVNSSLRKQAPQVSFEMQVADNEEGLFEFDEDFDESSGTKAKSKKHPKKTEESHMLKIQALAERLLLPKNNLRESIASGKQDSVEVRTIWRRAYHDQLNSDQPKSISAIMSSSCRYFGCIDAGNMVCHHCGKGEDFTLGKLVIGASKSDWENCQSLANCRIERGKVIVELESTEAIKEIVNCDEWLPVYDCDIELLINASGGNRTVKVGSLVCHQVCNDIMSETRFMNETILMHSGYEQLYMCISGLDCQRTIPIGTDYEDRQYLFFFSSRHTIFVRTIAEDDSAWHVFDGDDEIQKLQTYLKCRAAVTRRLAAVDDYKYRQHLNLVFAIDCLVATKAAASLPDSDMVAIVDVSEDEQTKRRAVRNRKIVIDDDDDEDIATSEKNYCCPARILVPMPAFVRIFFDKHTRYFPVTIVEAVSCKDSKLWLASFSHVDGQILLREDEIFVLSNIGIQPYRDKPLLLDSVMSMNAWNYVDNFASGRASTSRVDLFETSRLGSFQNLRTEFDFVQIGLLVLFQAIPLAAIDNYSGKWDGIYENCWIRHAENANCPKALLECLITLEAAIRAAWIKPGVVNWIKKFAASDISLRTGSIHSVALKLFALDTAILFDKQFDASSKSRLPIVEAVNASTRPSSKDTTGHRSRREEEDYELAWSLQDELPSRRAKLKASTAITSSESRQPSKRAAPANKIRTRSRKKNSDSDYEQDDNGGYLTDSWLVGDEIDDAVSESEEEEESSDESIEDTKKRKRKKHIIEDDDDDDYID